MAQLVKNPPAMQETWVQSLSWEDPLEKGTATHSSILAWRIPWTEETGRVTKSQTGLSDFHFHFHSEPNSSGEDRLEKLVCYAQTGACHAMQSHRKAPAWAGGRGTKGEMCAGVASLGEKL